jgi:hypothetical protein
MRNLAPIVLALVTGCGLRNGQVSARWTTPTGAVTMTAPASGAWCAERGTLLVQATEGDRVVGFTWHFDSLASASVPLTPPMPLDSTPVYAASAALRYVADGEVRGFRSRSGSLDITVVDTSMIDARLAAKLQRTGRTDSADLSATFRRIRLVRDTTLCHP